MTLSEKRKLAAEFIERVNPYEKKKTDIIMDLRAYVAFVDSNDISPRDITNDMMLQFASNTTS